jgi:galactitol-specific phosphotransferase system IIC component
LAESEWFIAGFVIGVIIGVLAGYMLSRYLAQPMMVPASVVFDRDASGRIVAIHYIPGAGSG